MSATTYRYLFSDILTNAVLGELSVTGVNCDEKLNTFGAFSAHLLLSGVDTTKLNVFNSTIPDKCAVYVDRNGVIIWGGVITSRLYKSKTQTMELTAYEWLYWLSKRLITNTSVFTNVDQCQIAQQLVQNAQSVPSGNVGILYNTEAAATLTSGVLRTQTYYAWELKPVLTAIEDLSKANNGFDFAIDCYYDGAGEVQKSFNTYYPRRGIAYSSSLKSVPTLELPAGNMVEYEYPEDGTLAANRVYAIGSGSNDGKLIATATDTAKLAAGWTLLETSVNDSSVVDGTLLLNLATGQVNAVSYPPTTMKVILSASQDPMLGTYEVGDDVRVRITDKFFPNGYDAVWRIVALAIQAGENGPERATLTLAQFTGV